MNEKKVILLVKTSFIKSQRMVIISHTILFDFLIKTKIKLSKFIQIVYLENTSS